MIYLVMLPSSSESADKSAHGLRGLLMPPAAGALGEAETDPDETKTERGEWASGGVEQVRAPSTGHSIKPLVLPVRGERARGGVEQMKVTPRGYST